jgi:hypothetical protein
MTTIPRHLMDRLPDAPRGKLRMLEQRTSDTLALSSSSYAQLMEIQRSIRNLNDRRTSISDSQSVVRERVPSARGHVSEDKSAAHRLAATQEIDEELASLNDQMARLGARRELSTAASQRSRDLLLRIAEWLTALPPDMLLIEHSGADRSNKSDVTPDAIEKRRRRIRALIADVKQTDAAPYPSALAKQRAREEIEQLAERGEPDFFPLIEQYRGKIRWPEVVLDFHIGLATPKGPDSAGLMACVFRDTLIAFSDRKIDEIADDANALTDEQRGEKFKTLLGDLLAVEREEETLIQAAIFDVDRR